MKNVTLIDSYHNSKRTWKLLGPDGEFIKKFAFSMSTTEIASQIGNLLDSR